MPDLEVTITLRLSDVDARRLRAAVEAVTGGANDDAAYKGHLAGLVQAAAMEYVEMVSGTRRFSRMGDLEEHRVFALSRALLDGRPMDDRAVSRLLQLTPTRSRSLVNSMAARYRFELDEVLMEQLKELLTTEDFAEQLKKKPAKRKAVEFECHYTALISYANGLLLEQDEQGVAPLKRKAGTSATWTAQPSTLKALEDATS